MANVICCALSPSCSVGKHVTWAMTRVAGRELQLKGRCGQVSGLERGPATGRSIVRVPLR